MAEMTSIARCPKLKSRNLACQKSVNILRGHCWWPVIISASTFRAEWRGCSHCRRKHGLLLARDDEGDNGETSCTTKT